MLQRFRNSPWVGAVIAMCAILWEGFWLIGPPLGIVKAERPLYLFWGLVALSVAAFQSFYTLIRENKQLKTQISGNRPFNAPRSYKQGRDARYGLTITNSEYAGYDVHIPDVPVGNSGYTLHFDGIFSQLLHKEEAFFPTWLDGPSGISGEGLFEVMRQADIGSVEFGIISKNTSPTPRWYRDNCAIVRDVQKHRSGLVLRHLNQELIPEPLMD